MPQRNAQFDIGHHDPHRDSVPLRVVVLALLAAPTAWLLQLNANSAIAGLSCLTDAGVARLAWGSGTTRTVIVAVNLAALALGLAGLAASAWALRRTRHRPGAGGVMEAGEGRTRLLVVWGFWIGILFLIAIGANTIAAFWRGMCPA
jgi:hypothetical protein